MCEKTGKSMQDKFVALRKNLRAHQDIWYVDLQHDVYSDCLKAVYDSLPALLGK